MFYRIYISNIFESHLSLDVLKLFLWLLLLGGGLLNFSVYNTTLWVIIFKDTFFVCVYVEVCVAVVYESTGIYRGQKRHQLPWIWSHGWCEPPCGCWEINLYPPQEQQTLGAPGPPPQPSSFRNSKTKALQPIKAPLHVTQWNFMPWVETHPPPVLWIGYHGFEATTDLHPNTGYSSRHRHAWRAVAGYRGGLHL